MQIHFATVAVFGLAAGLAATRWLIAEPVAQGEPLLIRPRGTLAVLGLVAFFVILIDGTSSYWSAVHLRTERHASAAVAAAGFTAFALAVALGRLVGDQLVAHLGRVRFVQFASSVAAAGATLVVTAPSVHVAVVGWATLGAGLAAIPPTLFGAAPTVSAAPPPVAIAAVATCGYLGSFTGPPLIGALAEITSLTAALGLLVGAAVATSLLAHRALSPPARGSPSSSRNGTIVVPSRGVRSS